MNAVQFSGIRELPRHFAQAMAHTLAAQNQTLLAENPPYAKDEPERKSFAQTHRRYAQHHAISARAYWDVVASDADIDLFLAAPEQYVNQPMQFNLYAGDRRDQSAAVRVSIKDLIAKPDVLFSRMTPDKAKEWVLYAMEGLQEMLGGPAAPVGTIKSGDNSIIYRPHRPHQELWKQLGGLKSALTGDESMTRPPLPMRRQEPLPTED